MFTALAALSLLKFLNPEQTSLYGPTAIPCSTASMMMFLSPKEGRYGPISQETIETTVKIRSLFLGKRFGQIWQLCLDKQDKIGKTGNLYLDSLLAFGCGAYYSYTEGKQDYQKAHDFYVRADTFLSSGGSAYVKPPFDGFFNTVEQNVIMTSMNLRKWNLSDFLAMKRFLDRNLDNNRTHDVSLMLGTICSYGTITENLTDRKFLLGLLDVCKSSIPRLMEPKFRSLGNVDLFLIMGINVASMTAEIDQMSKWYDDYLKGKVLTRDTAYQQALAATALIMTNPDEAIRVSNEIIKFLKVGKWSENDANALQQAYMIRAAALRSLGLGNESIDGLREALLDDRWNEFRQDKMRLTLLLRLLTLNPDAPTVKMPVLAESLDPFYSKDSLEQLVVEFSISQKTSSYQEIMARGEAILRMLGEGSIVDLIIREVMLRSGIDHRQVDANSASVQLMSLRSGYLDLWKRSIRPKATIGFVQEAQGNPMTRFGIELANLNKPVDAIQTVEAGRGWTALAATVKSPDKKKTLLQLASVPEVKDFQAWLKGQPKATIGLSFAMYEDRQPGVFIVTPKGVQYKTLSIPFKELEQLCQDWKSAIQGAGANATQEERSLAKREKELASKIEKLVFDPIRSVVPLRDFKRLLISPDGPLRYIPFRALIDASGARLVDQYRISIAPALRLYPTYGSPALQIAGASEQEGANIEIPTDLSTEPVAGGGSELVDMRNATDAISKIIKSSGQVGFFGSPISKAAAIKEMLGANLIHFYNHCTVNTRSALDSALLLNTNSGTPEVLTAMDISNLTLKARLATLWSCGTAKGSSGGGDGVIGMAWAFQAAGVPSQIASHWDVYDVDGAKLMRQFYHHAITLREELDEALDNAIKDYRNELRSHKDPGVRARADQPLFWAPYDLFGDFRKL